MWATIFIIPALILSGIISAIVSSGIRTATGSIRAGLAIGIFAGSCMVTASWILFLRLIRELEDNMYMDGFESLPVYIFREYLTAGIPVAMQLYGLVWVSSIGIKRATSWFKRSRGALDIEESRNLR